MIKDRAKRGELIGVIVLMCRDSSTVERAVDKGNLTSKELHQLVCRLRKCQMRYEFALYISHTSGVRIIAQGTNGLSREMLNKESLAVGLV